MLTVAVLADTHRSTEALANGRRGEIADTLLLRAVHRLNRFIKPDVTLILGDIIDAPDSPNAEILLSEMAELVGLIESPVLVLPGNHDGSVERFERIFGSCPECLDVKDVRFVAFLDEEMPGYNAVRSKHDLERMAAARQSWSGALACVQHVPLLAPGSHPCPYNYTNVEDVLKTMKQSGYSLSISGHYHRGIELFDDEGVHFMVAPALCDPPFGFSVLTFDEGTWTEQRQRLRMPEQLRLFDCHVHTPFAYCNENMDIPKALDLAASFGLAGMSFAEHSGQLYFGANEFWSGVYAQKGIQGADPSCDRMNEYLEAARTSGVQSAVGLEVDCDFRGAPILKKQVHDSVGLMIGSIHKLASFLKPERNLDEGCEEFLFLLERFLPCGIKALAHPFRVFARAGFQKPERLFEPTVRLLRENNVAAEINYHKNESPLAFVEMCLNAGVKLAFGSDAHNLYEVGEFTPHLQLMHQCGCLGQLDEVLISHQNVDGVA